MISFIKPKLINYTNILIYTIVNTDNIEKKSNLSKKLH